MTENSAKAREHNASDLAINGGPKLRQKPMPARKALGPDEILAMEEAIAYYRDSPYDPPYQGKFETEFCDAYVDFMGGGFADAVATGTGSIFVALEALSPQRGSEIIISPFVDAGPFNCILYQGCIPIVSDAAPNSYNSSVEQFLAKVTDRTSAVIAVHAAGDPLEVDQLVAEMHRRNILVLEDCSQAPGAIYQGRRIGTFGDIAATSTMYRKTLSAGGSGGLVYTRDKERYHRALACADRGKPIWREDYDFRSPGGHLFPALNWNTDEFSCAIGQASLKRLDAAIAARMAFVRLLEREVSTRSRACRVYALPDGASPFFLPIWVDTATLTCDKVSFAKALQAEGIDLNPHYNFLVQDWAWAAQYVPGGIDTPNALTTKNTSFNLFLNEKYGAEEVEDVVAAIEKVEAVYRRK